MTMENVAMAPDELRLLDRFQRDLPIEPRRALWNRLATDLLPRGIEDGITEVTLETLEPALDAIVDGQARGRWIVRIGG